MTTGYNKDVASGGQRLFSFFRLLFRWHGSFYKLIVYEFTIYFFVYLFLNIVHSFVLNDEQEKIFTEICTQLGRMSGYVLASVTFCLGFFIQQVYRRFCSHFHHVPWPDGFAFLVSVNVSGNDMRGRLLRRTMVRYAVASIIVTWMNFSERMKGLFPDLESLVVAGLLTEHEVTLLKTVERPPWRQMVAASWCAAVVKRARLENRIEDDHAFNAILNELDIIRMRCRRLISMNNRPLPLAYFHTVIIGVYAFFSIAAFAGSHRQQTQKLHKQLMVDAENGEIWVMRLLSQVITMMQFAICAGVLAISRSLLIPFGTDDNSINVEEIIRRHLSLAYMIVDDLHSVIPEMKDAYEGEGSIFHRDSGLLLTNADYRRRSSTFLEDFKQKLTQRRSIETSTEETTENVGYLMSVAPKKDETPAAAKSKEKHKGLERSRSTMRRLLAFREVS